MLDQAVDLLAPVRIDAAVATLDPGQVLDAAGQVRLIRDRAQAAELALAVGWADAHPAWESWQAMTVAGEALNAPSVPTITSSAVAEFGVRLRCSTVAAAHLIGEALELRHRLPRLWAGVLGDRIPAVRARRVAERTRLVSDAVADVVDGQAASVAAVLGPGLLDRLVEEAIRRHDPQTAAELAARAADARGVWVDEHPGLAGMAEVRGVLDVGDARALDVRLDDDARSLAGLLPGVSHQGCRATALGDLARHQHSLPADPAAADPTNEPGRDEPGRDEPGRDEPGRDEPGRTRPVRPVVLYLHLSDRAIGDGDRGWGRIDHAGGPLVPAELIRRWLGDPAVRLTVKPVIDLNQPAAVEAYAIPDRIAERVRLRDRWCVFPWCTRPATAAGVDVDHIVAHAVGGPTHTDNLAPLCRRHHRLKTFDGWAYRRDPVTGSYHWRSPHGQHVIRDRDGGTHDQPRPTPAEPNDAALQSALLAPPPDTPPPRRPTAAAARRLRRYLTDNTDPPPPAQPHDRPHDDPAPF